MAAGQPGSVAPGPVSSARTGHWSGHCGCTRNLSKSVARDTIAAALKGDVAAQHKIQNAIEAKPPVTEEDAPSDKKGRCCCCGPSPERKRKMRESLQLLVSGELDRLEEARTEYGIQMKAEWKAKCEEY